MGETPLDAVDEGHSASFESAASLRQRLTAYTLREGLRLRRVDHTTSPQRAGSLTPLPLGEGKNRGVSALRGVRFLLKIHTLIQQRRKIR